MIHYQIFTFVYKADVGNGLTENEFDHVFFGVSNNSPNHNTAEVSDWKWAPIKELKQELIINPDKYSPWLQQCLSEVINHKIKNIMIDNKLEINEVDL